MGFITKHPKEILAAFLITLVYFFTRLVVLTDVPIFTDEAIYIRWAQIALQDPNWRFISLTDGKQPLFIWLVALFLPFFSDPLIAGRIVSVLAGCLTMLGLYFLTKELFKHTWTGIVSAGLYAIFPFALVYDRLALYDSLIGTFTVWGLYFSIVLIRKVRLDIALLLGVVAGAGALNKSNAYFILYSFPFVAFILQWKNGVKRRKLLTLFGLFILAAILTLAMYSILRLSPFFYLINEKNGTFIYPYEKWLKAPLGWIRYGLNNTTSSAHNYLSFTQWIAIPFVQFPNNFRTLLEWMTTYMGIPFEMTVIGGLLIDKRYLREKAVLLFSFLFPFLALVSFGRLLYPRYILFMLIPLLPLIAYFFVVFFHFMKNKRIALAGAASLSAYALVSCFLILTNFAHAPIPLSDKGQLYTDWPAGAGVRESVQFFKEQVAKHGHIFIATEGTFGLMPYSYEIYFTHNPQVTVKGIWPVGDTPPAEVLASSQKMPTFFVFYQPCPGCNGRKGFAPEAWKNVKQVLQIQKINPNAYLTVYQVNPK